MRTDITEFFFSTPRRECFHRRIRAREEEILVGRIAFEEERISGIYVPLDRQGEFSKWWNKRLVGCCNRRVFIYWARESCTRRNLHGKVWIFHTHLTWFTSECRLIPPPYSSRAAGAQDPHERSAKQEETCLNVLRPFLTIILSETGQKTRWNLTVENHLFERKILSWAKEASSRIPSRILDTDKAETVGNWEELEGKKLLISEKNLKYPSVQGNCRAANDAASNNAGHVTTLAIFNVEIAWPECCFKYQPARHAATICIGSIAT